MQKNLKNINFFFFLTYELPLVLVPPTAGYCAVRTVDLSCGWQEM